MISITLLLLISVAAFRLEHDERVAVITFGSLSVIHDIFITGMPGYIYFLSDALVFGMIIEIICRYDSDFVFHIVELTVGLFLLSVAGWLCWLFYAPVSTINCLAISIQTYILVITILRGSTHGRRSARSRRRFTDLFRCPSDTLGAS